MRELACGASSVVCHMCCGVSPVVRCAICGVVRHLCCGGSSVLWSVIGVVVCHLWCVICGVSSVLWCVVWCGVSSVVWCVICGRTCVVWRVQENMHTHASRTAALIEEPVDMVLGRPRWSEIVCVHVSFKGIVVVTGVVIVEW